MPTNTEPMTNTRGPSESTVSTASMPPIDSICSQDAGTHTNTATTTRSALMSAEMKNPRLIADMPERSLLRGETAKMPMTAVSTPIAGMMSGRTRPSSPNAALPRMSAATRVTA